MKFEVVGMNGTPGKPMNKIYKDPRISPKNTEL